MNPSDLNPQPPTTNAYGIHGLQCLQRDDEAGRFASDEDARAHVIAALAAYDNRATVERLAEAAELALEMRWLGDDKPESSPVYLALTAALAAFRGEA